MGRNSGYVGSRHDDARNADVDALGERRLDAADIEQRRLLRNPLPPLRKRRIPMGVPEFS